MNRDGIILVVALGIALFAIAVDRWFVSRKAAPSINAEIIPKWTEPKQITPGKLSAIMKDFSVNRSLYVNGRRVVAVVYEDGTKEDLCFNSSGEIETVKSCEHK